MESISWWFQRKGQRWPFKLVTPNVVKDHTNVYYEDNVGEKSASVSAVISGRSYLKGLVGAGGIHTEMYMLIDSGATNSCLSYNIYKNYLSHIQLKPDPVVINGFSGGQLNAKGTVSVDLIFCSNVFHHDFLVVPDAAYDALLGADFLFKTNADISFSSNKIKLCTGKDKHVVIPLITKNNSVDAKVVSVSVSVNTSIPGNCESIVPGVIKTGDKNDMDGITGMTSRDDSLVEKVGLISAASLVTVNNSTIPVRLLNLSRKPVNLWKGQTLCYFHPDVQCHVNTFSLGDTITPSGEPKVKCHKKSMHPDIDLSTTDAKGPHYQQLKDLLAEYSDVFASSAKELGFIKNYVHEIDTGTHPPIKRPPYRLNPRAREIVQKQIDEWLDAGLISKGESPWSSSVILAVNRQKNSYRVCYDGRHINSITRVISAPIPRCDEVLNLVGDSKHKWFCGLDLKSGYNQVKLSEDARLKAAFVTPDGQYLPNCLGFGNVNSPQQFQKIMTEILHGLVPLVALCYIDDIVLGQRSIEGMLEVLEVVFSRFREANVKLNPKKCVFVVKRLPFLGHIISGEGIETDPKKIEIIRNFPHIPSCKQPINALRSFLGVSSYYRKFCPNFAQIAAPLYALFQKGVQFNWSDECETAFNTLKDLLVSSKVLKFPDFSKPFKIFCDSSQTGLGCVLTQTSGEGRQKKEHVISYAGRGLKSSEQKFSAYEREVLAVLFALETWESYLTGVPCEVVTDNRAVAHILNTKKSPNNRIARWAMKLSTYPNVKLIHRPGKEHSNADGLSRFPFDEILLSDIPEVSIDTISGEVSQGVSREEFAEMQYADPIWKPMINYLTKDMLPSDTPLARKTVLESPHFEMHDGILCRIYFPKGRHKHDFVRQICLPTCMHDEMIKTIHEDLAAGGCHFSSAKTYASMLDKYCFRNMGQKTKIYCKQCLGCNLIRNSPWQ